MFEEREHEGKIEDFERECDAQLSLDLLKKRFDEPFDGHLGIFIEQVGEVREEKLPDGWVKRCLNE